MSGVQSWAISVCFTVIAASILQYISPNGAMERVMKLVLGAFVLYVNYDADYQFGSANQQWV